MECPPYDKQEILRVHGKKGKIMRGGKKTSFDINFYNDILVDNISKGESMLILHADDYKPNPQLSLNLIKNSLGKGEEALHITNKHENRISLPNGVTTLDFDDGDLKNKITSYTNSLKLKKQFGRIILESPGNDFEKTASLANFVHDRVLQEAKKKWSRKEYKLKTTEFQKFLDFFLTVPILGIDNYKYKLQIISTRFSRCIFISKDTVFFYNKTFGSKILPGNMRENFIKNNLTYIVLFILFTKPMSGYEMIKTIFERFRVSLPQSTVYTTLYGLKKDGVIGDKKLEDNKKTKIFYLTDPKAIEDELHAFADFINLLSQTLI